MPPDIATPSAKTSAPLQLFDTVSLVEIEKIIAHRRRGKGYQWLALPRGAPQHETEWQKTGPFIDEDSTMTKAFYEYIVRNKLLSYLH